MTQAQEDDFNHKFSDMAPEHSQNKNIDHQLSNPDMKDMSGQIVNAINF